MRQSTIIPMPPLALGMTSLVLGVIASLLFFLPILGIPLSLCGIFLGAAGLIVFWRARGIRLRWALAGLATSCLALSINLAMIYAPSGFLHDPAVPRPWREVRDRPYNPPPAKQF